MIYEAGLKTPSQWDLSHGHVSHRNNDGREEAKSSKCGAEKVICLVIEEVIWSYAWT